MSKLSEQILELRKRIAAKANSGEESPEVSKLSTENIKLKHRLAILNKVIKLQTLQNCENEYEHNFKE